MLVRIDCTVPKLMLTSLAMLHISHLLSYIARVCTTLTFSSVVASLGQPDRPSSSMLSLPLYCPFYHCAIRKRLLPKVYNYLPLFIYLDILYVLFRIKDHSMANFHTPLYNFCFLDLCGLVLAIWNIGCICYTFLSLKDAKLYWLYHLTNRCWVGTYPYNFYDKN